MKTLLLFAFLLLNSILALRAQNWQTVQLHHPRFFISPDTLLDYGGFINAINIDSAGILGSDSAFFNFPTLRDTSNQQSLQCLQVNGPSWVGSPIIVQQNGINLFFNKANDTIVINTWAQTGETWRLFNFEDSTYIEATVANVFFGNVNGTADSIKTISLQCKNFLGDTIANFFNDKHITLSKNNGIYDLFDFYSFPNANGYPYYVFIITNMQLLTIGEIYDFNIGDEFGSGNHCDNSPGCKGIRKILDKWFSPLQDTMYYLAQEYNVCYTVNWSPEPHLDSTYTTGIDTLSFTHLNDYKFGTMPSESVVTVDSFGTHYFNTYQAYRNIKYNNRLYYTIPYGTSTGIGGWVDSCFYAPFEGAGGYWTSIKGCGSYWSHDYDYTSLPPYTCDGGLTYFKKGTELWGTSVDEIEKSNISLSLYPNPFSNSTTLVFHQKLQAGNYSLSLFNLLGKQVRNMGHLKPEGTVIYKEDLPPGIYFYKITNGQEVIGTGKMVVE